MAVDANPPSLGNSEVKQIHNLHHMLESGGGHVFPALIKASDSMGIEILGDIAESNIWNDAIAAKGMLSWLL